MFFVGNCCSRLDSYSLFPPTLRYSRVVPLSAVSSFLSCFLLSVSGRSRGNSGSRDALKDTRALLPPPLLICTSRCVCCFRVFSPFCFLFTHMGSILTQLLAKIITVGSISVAQINISFYSTHFLLRAYAFIGHIDLPIITSIVSVNY